MNKFSFTFLLFFITACAEVVDGDLESSKIEGMYWNGCKPKIIGIKGKYTDPVIEYFENIPNKTLEGCDNPIEVIFDIKVQKNSSDAGFKWALVSMGFLPGFKTNDYLVNVTIKSNDEILKNYEYKGFVRTVYGFWAFLYASKYEDDVLLSCGGSCMEFEINKRSLQRFISDAKNANYFMPNKAKH